MNLYLFSDNKSLFNLCRNILQDSVFIEYKLKVSLVTSNNIDSLKVNKEDIILIDEDLTGLDELTTKYKDYNNSFVFTFNKLKFDKKGFKTVDKPASRKNLMNLFNRLEKEEIKEVKNVEPLNIKPYHLMGMEKKVTADSLTKSYIEVMSKNETTNKPNKSKLGKDKMNKQNEEANLVNIKKDKDSTERKTKHIPITIDNKPKNTVVLETSEKPATKPKTKSNDTANITTKPNKLKEEPIVKSLEEELTSLKLTNTDSKDNNKEDKEDRLEDILRSKDVEDLIKLRKLIKERNKRSDRHLTEKDIEAKTGVMSNIPYEVRKKEDKKYLERKLKEEERRKYLATLQIADDNLVRLRIKRFLKMGYTSQETKEKVITMQKEDLNIQKEHMEVIAGIKQVDAKKKRQALLDRLNGPSKEVYISVNNDEEVYTNYLNKINNIQDLEDLSKIKIPNDLPIDLANNLVQEIIKRTIELTN